MRFDNQNATTGGIEEWLRAHGAVLTGNNAEFQLDTKVLYNFLFSFIKTVITVGILWSNKMRLEMIIHLG